MARALPTSPTTLVLVALLLLACCAVREPLIAIALKHCSTYTAVAAVPVAL
jgi:hypothetical protein